MSVMGFIKDNEVITTKSTLIVPIEYTHACAIGQTGCGKTTSFIYPNLDKRIQSGHSILLYDYKGKEHLSVKYFALKHKRLDDVVEVGKAWGSSINIIKYMNKRSLEKLFMDLHGHSKENLFWARSSTNVCVAILDILKSTQFLYTNCKRISESIDVDKHIFKKMLYKYDIEFTLKSLLTVVKSQESLSNFILNIHKITDIFESLIEDIGDTNKKLEKYDFIEIFYEIEVLKDKITTTKKLFSNIINEKEKKNSSQTIESLIVCINTPLMAIATIEYLNHDEFDIIDNMQNGKIIVVNTQSFSETILSTFNNSLFDELAKRSQQLDAKPVSIFIDEAQKIFSKNFDLPVDVLREAKVEVFLAFQNKELMIESLGENKFNALYKNIKKRFLFKNPEKMGEYDLAVLEQFEYYNDELKDYRVHKAKNCFINKKHLFKPELLFQQKLQLDTKYIFSEDIDDVILVFDEYLLEDNKVRTLNKDGEENVIKIYQDKYYDRIKDKFIEKMKFYIEEEPLPFPTDEFSYEDDFFDNDDLFDELGNYFDYADEFAS
ncbi:hypothetical protein ACN9JU_01615 [Aliarcobacter butzleri]|uniref:hypothetical protein n=1 Tax=Aliarcobacter butzleri TaxID=28197 RepID=UPI003B2176A0